MPSDGTTAFISYSREDQEFVLRMARDLKAAGANVWLDQLDIQPGQRWARALQDAITNAPRFLVVLSPASVNSTNVEDEVAFALEEHKTIIPVLYCDCKVPFQLRPFQYADFRTDYERGLKILLHTMDVDKAAGPVGTVLAPVAMVPKEVQPEAADADALARAAEQRALAEKEAQAAEQARLKEAERVRLEEERLAAEQARAEKKRTEIAARARRDEEAKQAAEQARLDEAKQAAKREAAEKKRRDAAEQAQRQEEARQAAEKTAAEQKRKEAQKQARLERERKEAADQARREKEARQTAAQQRVVDEAYVAAIQEQAGEEEEAKRAQLESGSGLTARIGMKIATGVGMLIIAGAVFWLLTWIHRPTEPKRVANPARQIEVTPSAPAEAPPANTATTTPTAPAASAFSKLPLKAPFTVKDTDTAKKTLISSDADKEVLLGEHRMSLQWISWTQFGKAFVTDDNGMLTLKGEQRIGNEYVTIDGTISNVEPKAFFFHGTIVSKTTSVNNGQPCTRTGPMRFVITGTRRYWRLQKMENPCEAVTDYVDIYLR